MVFFGFVPPRADTHVSVPRQATASSHPRSQSQELDLEDSESEPLAVHTAPAGFTVHSNPVFRNTQTSTEELAENSFAIHDNVLFDDAVPAVQVPTETATSTVVAAVQTVPPSAIAGGMTDTNIDAATSVEFNSTPSAIHTTPAGFTIHSNPVFRNTVTSAEEPAENSFAIHDNVLFDDAVPAVQQVPTETATSTVADAQTVAPSAIAVAMTDTNTDSETAEEFNSTLPRQSHQPSTGWRFLGARQILRRVARFLRWAAAAAARRWRRRVGSNTQVSEIIMASPQLRSSSPSPSICRTPPLSVRPRPRPRPWVSSSVQVCGRV